MTVAVSTFASRHGWRAAWDELRPFLLALAAGLACFALLFHAEAAAAVRVWVDSTAYSHCFLVLPIALWLAWDRREAARGLRPEPIAWPALAVVPFGLAWFAAERLGLMEGRQLAVLGMLEAMLVALLGWRLARAQAPALIYLVFLVPVGSFLVPTLQHFTARFIDVGLDGAGHPAFRRCVLDRDPGRDVLRRRGLRGLALPDRGDRVRRAVRLPDLPQHRAAARLPRRLDRGADHRQRGARARHRGGRLHRRRRRGGGGRPHHLWLGVLLGRDHSAGTGRAAVPRGYAPHRPRRAGARRRATCRRRAGDLGGRARGPAGGGGAGRGLGAQPAAPGAGGAPARLRRDRRLPHARRPAQRRLHPGRSGAGAAFLLRRHPAGREPAAAAAARPAGRPAHRPLARRPASTTPPMR